VACGGEPNAASEKFVHRLVPPTWTVGRCAFPTSDDIFKLDKSSVTCSVHGPEADRDRAVEVWERRFATIGDDPKQPLRRDSISLTGWFEGCQVTIVFIPSLPVGGDAGTTASVTTCAQQ
jgi:hypothetical protein